ncbi:MAG: flavodoxin [Prevotellaceae bacterium]|jgi:flavodoxin I|nr:flavodoxin [Prevotellaceae bacterium]
MKKIVIIYGSTTGNTESAAKNIAGKLSTEEVRLIDVANLKAGDPDAFPNLILGTSTWGFGDLQDDWESALSILAKSDLTGKKVALFGLGDSDAYADTFVNGMGILYETLEDKGCEFIGKVPVDGYTFDASQAVRDGYFVGLALNEDGESNLTDARIKQWIAQILPEFK